ncbi:MAG: hypothetical protein OEQ28_05445 [Acidobacteriota bacterium]|nr:hypothetical protein [Acidobacteriota bacterium]
MSFTALIIMGVLLSIGLLAVVLRLSSRSGIYLLGFSLIAAALIYVGFAVVGLANGSAGSSWIAFEIGGLVFYGSFAYLGIRISPWYLAAGWALHVIWDTTAHTGAAFVPAFYPGVCIGFDAAVAVFTVYLMLRTNRN